MNPRDMIKRLREARKAATQGEWEIRGENKALGEIVVLDGDWDGGFYKCATAYKPNKNNNPAFICEAANSTEALCSALEIALDALDKYTHYDKETVRHMDTEFLEPERIAVIKPLNSLGKGYAPEDMHPPQIYQDGLFTYGPKQKPGKFAREALTKISAIAAKGEG